MTIKKLNISDFTDSVLNTSMIDLDFGNNIGADYISAFVNKKINIDYAIGQDFHDSVIYNLYGSRATFKEFIEYIEKNPIKIKKALLKRRVLSMFNRIDNRLGHAFKHAGVKWEGNLKEFKMETRQRSCQPIRSFFYKNSKTGYPYKTVGNMSLEELLNLRNSTAKMVEKAEKLYNNAKGDLNV